MSSAVEIAVLIAGVTLYGAFVGCVGWALWMLAKIWQR